MLTKEDAHELITYDQVSGRAWHNIRDIKWFRDLEGRSAEHSCKLWNSRYAGKEIVCKSEEGYIHPMILCEKIPLHRLIWLYMTGEWPKGDIDHINGRRDDNRWCNLREVTRKENCRNRKRPKTNTSGCIGVSQRENSGKWRAYINNDKNKRVYIGSFISKEEAIAARKAAEIEYGYSPTHGRES